MATRRCGQPDALHRIPGCRGRSQTHGVLTVVGIDAEPHEPLPPDVAGAIALDKELVGLAELTAAECSLLGSGPILRQGDSVLGMVFP
jgi:hypothetical protein